MLLASPVDFVAVPGEGGEQEFTLWKPVPPPGEAHIDGGRGNQTQPLNVLHCTGVGAGYKALGLKVARAGKKPDLASLVCVHEACVHQ